MPFYSSYATFETPNTTLHEVIFRDIDRVPDQDALIDAHTGRTCTYGQHRDSARRVAAALQRRGLNKGDRLAILSPNCIEYPIAVHGAMLAGAVVTTLNPQYTEPEIEHQLHDSGARFLLTTPEMLPKARPAAEKAHIERIFTFGDAGDCEAFTALMAENGEPVPVAIDPAEDMAAMLYSSGTTGLPKGVMLTHRNLVSCLIQTENILGAGPSSSLLLLPVFHIFGFHVITNFDLANRGTIVMMSKFDMELFLATVERQRIERACLVPPIILGLVKSPLVDKYDLSSLKRIFCGAAPLDSDLAAVCEKRLGCKVRQAYGMTEASPSVCSHPLDGEKVRHGSVGVLVANTEGKLVDLSTGEEAKRGEPGELWVRGPQVMKGYYNKPAATGDTVTADGWLRTGDIAQQDEDGWLYIVDRAKELIKYKGLQVAPAELEAVLLSHPMIADAAVIGIPDDEAGEIPKAFVVTKGDISAGEVMAFVAERVAPYKKLRRLEFIDAIPKSPSGKILRRVLRDREKSKS